MPYKLSPVQEDIWHDKYRFKANDGTPVDGTIEDTWDRIASALSDAEERKGVHFDDFRYALDDFKFLTAGRVTAGAGTGRQVTLLNCYVMGDIDDSLGGIHDRLKESAIAMQQGAGIGNNFSTLRPRGELIKSLGSGSSGPLSFMDQWDAMCRSIMSAGHRRGAMMGTMRDDHPDILEFIDAKANPARMRMFNLSVLVSDKLMRAVKDDADWDLVWKGQVKRTIKARELWGKIMRNTYDFADPGVLFIDRINEANPLKYCETISATNPCGEQPLPPFGACCLGSINLAKFVSNPFTARAEINWSEMDRVVRTAIRMLDNVLDVSGYPLEAQRIEAMAKRRVGLGITAFANMLAMLGIRYSSNKAGEMATNVTRFIADIAHVASVELGKEKGSFPLFSADAYGCTHRRNSHVTSIAPTGTISMLAGNVSSGIEPVFDLKLTRKLLNPDGSFRVMDLSDYGYGVYKDVDTVGGIQGAWWAAQGGESIFETAAKLSADDHLRVLAACRPHVDSSISKTINLPEDISFEEFQDVYLKAYALGCKSCTTYRPNEVTGSILTSDTMKVKEKEGNVVELTKPMVRPEVLDGKTYKLKPGDHALYVTITDVIVNGQRRPFEIFINTKNLEHQVWLTALTRMISAVFRKGGDVSFIVEELTAVHDPRGGFFVARKHTPSIVAGLGDIIQRHLEDLGQKVEVMRSKVHCPKCQTGALIYQEGCHKCDACNYSKCG